MGKLILKTFSQPLPASYLWVIHGKPLGGHHPPEHVDDGHVEGVPDVRVPALLVPEQVLNDHVGLLLDDALRVLLAEAKVLEGLSEIFPISILSPQSWVLAVSFKIFSTIKNDIFPIFIK